ncbi:hypothetical protein LTR99_010840 [Exophiala xenobiotica]|uniref:Zn(2)-C6 fungal-type domain-containing protein n=1 Tax=Vermiconidia calcicola TaxID=1690605 RepID=A0AAV9PSP4_9PEZI|nr:hypothetical protein LTR92_005454 [Exophiala xenobiotica]KAK5528103.1 hypothetical protein LTR25_010618 [Vermiconidia calcicola]KAK5533654.1 hypothetical protein LTR23_009135 [Chaetothyriales sp. CCFEE 6169]KAK5207723.1 hypothetical protein LTR41_006767 [Exophiala xenobiotica]KAK5220750.1 hypothetical protein LTR72_007372 [Exophiala xenobiotica]
MADAEDTHSGLEPRRACQECNRKKTKCDMRRPVCGLCLRTGNSCSFPSKRKKPVLRKPHLKVQSRKISDSLSRLVQVLETASRAGEEIDATNGTREIPQSLLKDSLKDLLAEIKTSDIQANSSNGPATEQDDRQPSESTGENGEDEDEDVEGDAPDLPHVRSSDRDSLNANDAAYSEDPDVDDGISCSVAIDLVNSFFGKVQPWLPILHRPRFQARYESKLLVSGDVMKALSADECLLFYGIFALSARFSSHPKFSNIPPNKRGQDFAERAKDVYTQGRTLKTPSLIYLQGCILLASYFYTSGPTHQGWLVIGVCVRMAYDLGLFEIDEDDWTPASPVDHVEKEELRRAWWLVWELDTFASTVSRKPYAIDRKRMSVTLPISDEAWFSEVDVPSAEMNLQPGQSWRSLHGSANQDERAWFLVANSFMATLHDRLQQKQDVSPDEKLTLENEVCCFKLALPPSLRLDIETLTFTPSSFARCNWVIGTHLMLMACSFMVAGISTGDSDDNSISGLSASGMLPLRQRAIDLSRIISLWDTRYIVVAHPFLACMMLPPYAVDSSVYRTQSLVSSTHDLAKLVLEHFAERWTLGSVVSEIAKMMEQGGPRNTEEKHLVKRYALFFRIPRLSGNSPAFLQPDYGQPDRNGSTIGDETVYASQTESQQRQVQTLPGFATAIGLTGQTYLPNYQAPMFDPQMFPPLQANAYDSSNEVDLGFSEFFGSYQDTDLSWLK